MTELRFYSRPDCHLCEIAWELLRPVVPDTKVRHIDIESHIDLVSRYGWRVPVLHRSDNAQELDWPFTAEDVRAFLMPETTK